MTTAISTEVQTKTPYMLWGQNDETIFLSIQIDTPKKVQLDFEKNSLLLEVEALHSDYSLNMNLFDSIDAENSSYQVGLQKIECKIKKLESKLWNSLSLNNQYKHFIKIDWDKWSEINDEPEPNNMMGGGMPDLSSMMGGGGGGMPDLSSMMGGGGGMPDLSNMMGGGGEGMPDLSMNDSVVEPSELSNITENNVEDMPDLSNINEEMEVVNEDNLEENKELMPDYNTLPPNSDDEEEVVVKDNDGLDIDEVNQILES